MQELIDGLKHGEVPPPHDEKDHFPTGEKRDADAVDDDKTGGDDHEASNKRRKTDAADDKATTKDSENDSKPEDDEMKDDGESHLEKPEDWTTGTPRQTSFA